MREQTIISKFYVPNMDTANTFFQKKKFPLLLTAAVIITIAALIAAYFIFLKKPGIETPQAFPAFNPAETPGGLGAQIFEQNANPIQNKLPDINPLKNTNPFDNIYKNPFE